MLIHDVVPTRKRVGARRGMTLIELLVVVAIVVTLLAASLPMMQPALREARVRESARQLSVFCAVAKGRARELGRPAGVWIDRAAPGGNAAFEIHIAEEPLPYAGDFVDATASFDDNNGDGQIDGRDIVAPSGPDDTVRLNKRENSIAILVIKAGDYIQFDRKGPRYRITAIRDPGGAADYELKIAVPEGVPAAQHTSRGVSYTVFRQPVKSSLPSLQLGGGSVIDLEYSGIGAANTTFNARHTNLPNDVNDTPVIVMFDPSGTVSRIYSRFLLFPGPPPVYELSERLPNASIYFLVGRFDQTIPPPDPTTGVSASVTAEQTNLQDDSTIWISIGARTGSVTTAENISATSVQEARVLARSAQTMGGN